MILRGKILRRSSEIYSPEDSSLEKIFPGGGVFFAQTILRQIILR
jgi:hypothetical protein